jgi:hypothetical protein
MLSAPIYVACVILAASGTVLTFYFIQFVRFVKSANEERRIQDLNKTVSNILKYQERDRSPTIIDITDYTELGPLPPTDAYIEEMSNKSLIYMDDIKMWVKINKRSI